MQRIYTRRNEAHILPPSSLSRQLQTSHLDSFLLLPLRPSPTTFTTFGLKSTDTLAPLPVTTTNNDKMSVDMLSGLLLEDAIVHNAIHKTQNTPDKTFVRLLFVILSRSGTEIVRVVLGHAGWPLDHVRRPCRSLGSRWNSHRRSKRTSPSLALKAHASQ